MTRLSIRQRLSGRLGIGFERLAHDEHRLALFLSLVIGALVGLVIVAFILLTGRLAARMYPAGVQPWRRLLVPTAGSLVAGWLLFRYFPLARGSGPLLSSLVAIVFLGERISALGAAGIAGVVLGVFLIAGGPGLWRAAHDPVARKRVRKGMFYGVLTGAFIASYTLVDGYAVRWLLMSPILVDYMGNFVRVALLAPAVLRDRATAWVLWQKQWRYALAVAAVSPIAYVLVLYAMQQAPLSHVAPAREVSMLFAALIGGQLLGEGERGLRILGACCIAAGVAALGLG